MKESKTKQIQTTTKTNQQTKARTNKHPQKPGLRGKHVIYSHRANRKGASLQFSPHLLLLISLAAFRVRRRKQTKDVELRSSDSQAPKENFARLNTLSPGLTAILNWSSSTSSHLTIQLTLYSVYTPLIVSNYCVFFWKQIVLVCAWNLLTLLPQSLER